VRQPHPLDDAYAYAYAKADRAVEHMNTLDRDVLGSTSSTSSSTTSHRRGGSTGRGSTGTRHQRRPRLGGARTMRPLPSMHALDYTWIKTSPALSRGGSGSSRSFTSAPNASMPAALTLTPKSSSDPRSPQPCRVGALSLGSGGAKAWRGDRETRVHRPVGEPGGTRERRPDPSTARAMSVPLGDLLAEQPARCDSGRAALPFEREPCHITCVRHARRMSDRGEWVYPSARFEPPERGRYQNVQAAGVRGSGT
jgi:hypothetical protein